MNREERRERRETIVREWESGQKVADLSAKYNLCRSYILRILREESACEPGGRMETFNCYSLLADLIHTKQSFAAIAKKHNISRQRVQQVYERATGDGIRIKPRTRVAEGSQP